MTSSPSTPPQPFTFPASHAFPPLYTLQPNPSTRHAQFQKWSRTIQLYCRHHRLFRLSLPSCLDLPLFKNSQIRRKLGAREVREVVGWMGSGDGGRRAEWIDAGAGTGEQAGAGQFWVFWKRPEEWAEGLLAWVERTGQKGVVLTVWEILEGEATLGEDFHEMDGELFNRALGILVKKGKAQVFGEEDSRGVKFF